MFIKSSTDTELGDLVRGAAENGIFPWLDPRFLLLWHNKTRKSTVGIATGYGLDDTRVGVESRQDQEFSLLYSVQTGSGAHPASCPLGTGGFLPGSKAAGA
jgi:hypothetical protein